MVHAPCPAGASASGFAGRSSRSPSTPRRPGSSRARCGYTERRGTPRRRPPSDARRRGDERDGRRAVRDRLSAPADHGPRRRGRARRHVRLARTPSALRGTARPLRPGDPRPDVAAQPRGPRRVPARHGGAHRGLARPVRRAGVRMELAGDPSARHRTRWTASTPRASRRWTGPRPPLFESGLLDHGVIVPLCFLAPRGAGRSWSSRSRCLPLATHRDLGRDVREAAADAPEAGRVHRQRRLQPPPHPRRAVRRLLAAGRRCSTRRSANVSPPATSAGSWSWIPRLVEAGGECGLAPSSRSAASSATDPCRARVLAYEGPWGVGYLTALVGQRPRCWPRSRRRPRPGRRAARPGEPRTSFPRSRAARSRRTCGTAGDRAPGLRRSRPARPRGGVRVAAPRRRAARLHRHHLPDAVHIGRGGRRQRAPGGDERPAVPPAGRGRTRRPRHQGRRPPRRRRLRTRGPRPERIRRHRLERPAPRPAPAGPRGRRRRPNTGGHRAAEGRHRAGRAVSPSSGSRSTGMPERDSRHPSPHTRVLAVVGPTAVGKTALAEQLALALGRRDRLADSMQVYRGMDIGTAKPPAGRAPRPAPPPGRRGPRRAVLRRPLPARGPRRPSTTWPRAAGCRSCAAARASTSGLPSTTSSSRPATPARGPGSGSRRNSASSAPRPSTPSSRARPRGGRHDPPQQRPPSRARAGDGRGGCPTRSSPRRLAERSSVYDARFLGLSWSAPCSTPGSTRGSTRCSRRGCSTRSRRCSRPAARRADSLAGHRLQGVRAGRRGRRRLDEAAEAVKQATRRYAKRQLTWFRADPRVSWLDVTGMSPREPWSARAPC